MKLYKVVTLMQYTHTYYLLSSPYLQVLDIHTHSYFLCSFHLGIVTTIYTHLTSSRLILFRDTSMKLFTYKFSTHLFWDIL